jgi:hypothetical protein
LFDAQATRLLNLALSNPVVAPKRRGPGRKSETELTTITEADTNIMLEDSVTDVWKHVSGIGQYIV